MEVNEALKLIEWLFKYYRENKNEQENHFEIYTGCKEELVNYVLSLQAENKALKAENKVYRNEQSGWVKEIERRQAKIRELEKLDLNVRGLMLENKTLKKEKYAYKEMWKRARIILDLNFDEVSRLNKLEDLYLGGGE